MPTYQYACTVCGHELEAVQSFTDDPLTECPTCQGRLRKRFGSVGVVFKGPGFYRTDSRTATGKGGSTEKAPETKGADTATGKPEPGKTDTGRTDTGKAERTSVAAAT